MKIQINFRSSDPNVCFDLFGTSRIESFVTKIKLDENISIQMGQLRFQEKSAPQPYELFILITKHVLIPLSGSLVAKWLTKKLKNKTEEITIEGVTIELKKEKIERVLINKINN